MLRALAVLLVCCICSSIANPNEFIFCMNGVPPKTIAVNASDQIDVWYLEAPVFEGTIGPVFQYVNGYHTGIGFYDRYAAVSTAIRSLTFFALTSSLTFAQHDREELHAGL
jgi:hypothetical protein